MSLVFITQFYPAVPKNQRLEMKNKKIRDEKLQYNINREAAKISALSYE